MDERLLPYLYKDLNGRSWFEHRHLVTFADTNVVGNVYFSNYFRWQGECREAALALVYPEVANDLKRGFGLATEFANMDFSHEAFLFDRILIRMTTGEISRTRIDFIFEFYREPENLLLAKGRQAVIWINQQHHPSVMPDELYEMSVELLGRTAS